MSTSTFWVSILHVGTRRCFKRLDHVIFWQVHIYGIICYNLVLLHTFMMKPTQRLRQQAVGMPSILLHSIEDVVPIAILCQFSALRCGFRFPLGNVSGRKGEFWSMNPWDLWFGMIEARLCQGPVVSIRVVRYFGTQSATGGNEQTWWCVVMCKAAASWGSSTRQPAAVALLPKKFGGCFEFVAGHTLLAVRKSKKGLDWTRWTWMKYRVVRGGHNTTCGGEPIWTFGGWNPAGFIAHWAMTGGQTPIPFHRFF